MEIGRKAIVSELAETPLEGIEHSLEIVNQPVPDINSLDNLVWNMEAKSFGWVVMQSSQIFK